MTIEERTILEFRATPAGLARVIAWAATFSLVGGCGGKPAPEPGPGDAPAPAARVVRVVPSELFVGDLKPLEPHLGLTSGRVRLEFQGSEVWIKTEVVQWERGKRSELGSSKLRLEGPGEASISLKEETDSEGKWKYRFVRAIGGKSGGGTLTSWLDLPELGKEGRESFDSKLHEPIDLPAGKSVDVWAHIVYKVDKGGPSHAGKGSPEEQAKQADWAIVLRVSWEEIKDR